MLLLITLIHAQEPAVQEIAADSAVSVDTVLSEKSIADSSAETDSLQGDSSTVATVSSEEKESIELEGLILDSLTGEPVAGVQISVGGVPVDMNGEGEFSITLDDTTNVGLTVSAEGYGRFSKELEFEPDNRFYFVTVQLSRAKEEATVVIPADTTKGIPWEITGSIVNSRFDVAIEDTTSQLFFDGKPVQIGKGGNFKEGRFKVVTKVSGEHTFELRVEGYHTVFNKIVLTEDKKHIYFPIATTQLGHDLVRREMVVTAQAEPLHERSGAAVVTLTRKDIQRTAATMTDPIRVLQTLPGVASESDASARPIVRGGDVLESRVFIDGIPLIQPYHFGGVRSIFNQSGVENLTLYKSGFPSKYHDAQSAIITVDMRDPLDEGVVVLGDVNLMQYNAYVSFPILKEKLGMYISTQGSYANVMFKAGWGLMSRFTEYDRSYFEQQKDLFNIPDYQDVGGGVTWRISDRLKLSVHESFNTDRFKSTYADTAVTATYNYDNVYYYYDTLTRQTVYYHEKPGIEYIDSRLRDTSFSVDVSVRPYDTSYYYGGYGSYYDGKDDYYSSYEPIRFEDPNHNGSYFEGRDFDSYSVSSPFLEYDTIIDYKSRYNILHANLEYSYDKDNQIDFKLAWQKRWWDLTFPDDFSEFIQDSKYDVNINQVNLIADWTNTKFGNHTFSSGMQLDLTVSDYDVYTPRAVHEIITRGNTNFGDFWGPVTGDTGLDIGTSIDTGDSYYYNDMVERMLVAYKGDKTFLNGSLFFEDEWRVNEKLRLNMGTRLEVSSVDTSICVSPRVTSTYSINNKNEFTASAGLYTQNNYDIATMALSEVLKPEKVVHADIGLESQLLPWLSQKVNIFGKYYYDLASERIDESDPVDPLTVLEQLEEYVEIHYPGQTIDDFDLMDLYSAYMMEFGHRLYSSRYSNSGKGYAYGLEYILQYKPRDYWNGWLSFTLQNAQRQRHPGWRWHTFPFSRPLMVSWVNYYRLPRKYEIGLKYRFMLGMPYTEVDFDSGITVGDYNAKQYAPYSRLDIRIAKGVETKHTKMHFYLEVWNAMNKPNVFRLDSETKKIQTTGFDIPATVLFLGLDFEI